MSSLPQPLTFVYDLTHDLELDVYLPDSIPGNSGIHAPAVIWFHGGGLINGGKADINPYLLGDVLDQSLPYRRLMTRTATSEKLLPQGLIVISPNYRLLIPLPSGQEIISDVHALFDYLSCPGTDMHRALAEHDMTLDTSRLAVYSISSGAYPARAAATLDTIVTPPKALVMVSGMGGDFLLDHWIQPKSGSEQLSVPADILNQVHQILEGGRRGDRVFSDLPMFGHRKPETAVRVGIFKTLYNTGTILDHVLGIPGLSADLRAFPYAQRLTTIPESHRHLLLPITERTCPTLLVHGTDDKQVPFVEAQKTWEDLGRMSVEARNEWFDGGGHAVGDPERMGMARDQWNGRFDRVLTWLEEVLRR
ncbi:MAG: hypothetical protein TREMPRED_002982 [Tremellales sp. Tagirdzhanova-0007]|nr:MAG: hypothetical protein TREMPRED_002982 [Tremellales sp. Tagirdzhanova-0007]